MVTMKYGWRDQLIDLGLILVALFIGFPVAIIAVTKEKILSVIYWTGIHITEAWEHLILAVHGKKA